MIPRYYQSAIALLIRFMLIMLFFGLIAGIIYAESAKKLSLETAGLTLSFHGNYYLSLLHGHTFMWGVFIPLSIILLWVLPVWLLKTPPVGPAAVKLTTFLYIPTALWTWGLLIYKAYATQLAIRAGATDLVVVDHLLFGSNHTLRTIAYAIPHTVLAVSLIVLIVSVWRSLSTIRYSE